MTTTTCNRLYLALGWLMIGGAAGSLVLALAGCSLDARVESKGESEKIEPGQIWATYIEDGINTNNPFPQLVGSGFAVAHEIIAVSNGFAMYRVSYAGKAGVFTNSWDIIQFRIMKRIR